MEAFSYLQESKRVRAFEITMLADLGLYRRLKASNTESPRNGACRALVHKSARKTAPPLSTSDSEGRNSPHLAFGTHFLEDLCGAIL